MDKKSERQTIKLPGARFFDRKETISPKTIL